MGQKDMLAKAEEECEDISYSSLHDEMEGLPKTTPTVSIVRDERRGKGEGSNICRN